jgi:hypothetical protein
MHVEHVGLLGWTHTLGCLLALVTGAWNMVVFDRGRWHRLRGHAYAISMLVSNVLVFGIYKFDMDFIHMKFGPGVLGFFHWLAIAAIVFTLIGWYAATRQRHAVWAYTHPVAMTLSYYVLAGGLANELFARLDVLRPLAVTIVDGQQRFGSRITGMTQGSIMLATLLLIVLYVVRVAIRRHKRRKPVAAMA